MKMGNRILRTADEEKARDWTLIYNTFDVASDGERYRTASQLDRDYCKQMVRNAIASIREESETGADQLKNFLRGMIIVSPDLEGLLD